MGKTASRLAEELGLILLRLTPAGAFLSDNLAEGAREAIVAALPKREVSHIDSLAKGTAKSVRLKSLGTERSDGAANSAAFDVLSTIERSQITVQVLVELDLSPRLLIDWMTTQHGLQDEQYASGERKRNYYEGVSMFARRLVADAMELPGIQVVLLGEVLSRQRRILSALGAAPGEGGRSS